MVPIPQVFGDMSMLAQMVDRTDKTQFLFGVTAVDFTYVHGWLTSSYWSPGISRDDVEKAFQNSIVCISAFVGDRQVGVARAVSDTIRFAYIADVYVDENFRKLGIGQKLVEGLMLCQELSNVRTWLLKTRDAHGLYSKLGFKAVSDPESYMVLTSAEPSNVDKSTFT